MQRVFDTTRHARSAAARSNLNVAQRLALPAVKPVVVGACGGAGGDNRDGGPGGGHSQRLSA